jgi:hypothetical protein
MASLGYPKDKHKTLEFAQQHFSKFTFSQINLDPMVKGLNKINVHKV